MQKRDYKKGIFIPAVYALLLSGLLFLFAVCRNNRSGTEKNPDDMNVPRVTTSEVVPDYVRFRSFQNPDSTWGYTIFVNGKPYLHYSRIYASKTGLGFTSKKNAETVAGLLVKKIQNGDLTPKLNKKIIDSLELNMQMKE